MKDKKQILILIAFIGVIIIHHVFGYVGHYGFDDLHYAELANDFNNGIIDSSDHFTFRTSIIFLTSISYLIFGISDFASSLPSILISIAILFLIYNLLKDKGNLTLIVGLALTALSNEFLFYSDKLMPDIYVALSFFYTLYLIHQYRYGDKKRNIVLISVLLNITLLFGFMSKGTIVLILPLLIYLVIVDFLQKKHIKFWIYSLVSGVLIISIYFLIIGLLTGDFFQRFEAMKNNSYLNLCSYDKQYIGILIKRILYEFYEMIVNQGMAIGFIFVIAFLIKKKSLEIFKMKDSNSFWIASSLILLLSSNFMSISFTSYSPMCIDPRHYLFLIPIVSISAPLIIKDLILSKSLIFSIIAVFFPVTIISFFLAGNSFWLLYLPLFLLVLIYLFIKNNRINQNVFVLAIVTVLLLKPIDMITYAIKVDYNEQKKTFIQYMSDADRNSVIITNRAQKRLGDYYNNFNDNVTILRYSEVNGDSTDKRDKIMFMNYYTRYLSGLNNNDLPYYAKNISLKNKLLYENKDLDIQVYKMNDFSIPEQTSKLLLQSINNFENSINNWNQDEKEFTNKVHYEGSTSSRLNEFSPTFVYSVDSLEMDNVNQLIIKCKVHCNFQDYTNAKLVISIEDKIETYIWNAIEINEYIEAYSNWWPVNHEIYVNKNELKENSIIKIYVYNGDKKEGYIDNFQVELLGNYNK